MRFLPFLLVSLLAAKLSAQSSVSPSTGEGSSAAIAAEKARARDCVPSVAVWRSGAQQARLPKLLHPRRYAQVVLDAADEAVLVRLTFHPAMAGSGCTILPSEDWVVEAARFDEDGSVLEGGRTVLVGANGRATFLLRRPPASKRGSVRLQVHGYVTEVPFIALTAEEQQRLRAHPVIASQMGL
ncbi:MAG: hypothetical protein JSR82_01845 [Verrucomicrobia bacterium]|nr:hypothetical protein [Verrucomicrobiota bacterium]